MEDYYIDELGIDIDSNFIENLRQDCDNSIVDFEDIAGDDYEC